MHCNLRPSDAAPVVLCFQYDAHSEVVNLSFPSWLITFSLLIPYVTLWPWLLTFGRWSLHVYRLWRDQTPCQNLAKSNNLRLNHSDLKPALTLDFKHCAVSAKSINPRLNFSVFKVENLGAVRHRGFDRELIFKIMQPSESIVY